MKIKEETAARLKWMATITVTTLGVYLCFKYFLPLILPFVFAYFLAWIIRPVTEFLYRRLKIPRIVGGTVSLLVLTALTDMIQFAGKNVHINGNIFYKPDCLLDKYVDQIAEACACQGCQYKQGSRASEDPGYF
jgi:hypothetical protein